MRQPVQGGLLIVARMPVEFLSDAEAAAYGRYDGGPTREELDRVFFLDDADLELVDRRRGEHNRLGFALQLTTVRWLGVFLPDPTAVPAVVLSYVASQLEIGDPSCVGRYLERRPTRFDHAEEIKRACGLREFAHARGEFEEWVAARAWMTGDGPRAIFADAVGWLRERDVLLPGVTTLTRLVARARADGDERLWETLAAVPTIEQERVLEGLLEVGEAQRFSDLERWRKGPADPTGKSLRLCLRRVAEIHDGGIDGTEARALVPTRRRVNLARYGMAAKAPRLRRHPPARRVGTLVATVVHLQAASIDDCLELFDLMMVTELLGKAERETDKQRAREHPRLARAAVKLAAVVRILRPTPRAPRDRCGSPTLPGPHPGDPVPWRTPQRGRSRSWVGQLRAPTPRLSRTRSSRRRCARGAADAACSKQEDRLRSRVDRLLAVCVGLANRYVRGTSTGRLPTPSQAREELSTQREWRRPVGRCRCMGEVP